MALHNSMTVTEQSELPARAANVIARCRRLARVTDVPGQTNRVFLSPAMRECMRIVREWMEAAGMSVLMDAGGNLRGRYPGDQPNAPCLLLGSHLDTVPNSGAFDGVLGVMLGLELVMARREKLPFAIELIGFSEEEGVRYGVPFIGSRALTGRVDEGVLATPDSGGASISSAIRSFGLDASMLGQRLLSQDAAAYLEFHIEQGAWLESKGMSLGVVETIAGQSRGEVTFTGRAGHAGATPMGLRRDALAAAAAWVSKVERIGLSTEGLVATVGDLHVQPGAANVIAGKVQASLDVRHGRDEVRSRALDEILATAASIAQHRGLKMDWRAKMNQASVAMDAGLSALAMDAVRCAGVEPLRMVSGAGHDAMIMAEHVPSAMIFLRSPGGISHHPDESVRSEDVENALAAGDEFLRKFAGWRSPLA
jgi:allantoate deiminase